MRHPDTINGVDVPYSSTEEELIENIRNDNQAKWSSFIALGNKNSEKSIEFLLSCLSSEDWRIRRAALEAAKYHEHLSEHVDAVVKALKDTSAYVIREACLTIGDVALSDLHEEVFLLLSSKDDNTRANSMYAIDKIWQDTDYNKVLEIFFSDTDIDNRRRAAQILFNHANINTWQQLFDLWKNDSLGRHRMWACKLATVFGLSSVIADIEKLKNDPDGHVRKAAQESLKNG